MFEDFLNNLCNIYHAEDVTISAGYGIRNKTVKAYSDTPAAENVPCHFHIRSSNNIRITQQEPYTSVEGDMKISLPAGTNVRKGDVIEDCENGLRYRIGAPRTVHAEHHIVASLYREGSVESAI